jgi:hypothetical protein
VSDVGWPWGRKIAAARAAGRRAKIRHAGAPVITAEGYALCSMRVVDREARAPRALRAAQMLRDFAGIVVELVEARRMATGLKRLCALTRGPVRAALLGRASGPPRV